MKVRQGNGRQKFIIYEKNEMKNRIKISSKK